MLPFVQVLVLSDIYANLEALEAVPADAQGRDGFDAILCMGDTVGYGPDPWRLYRPNPRILIGGGGGQP